MRFFERAIERRDRFGSPARRGDAHQRPVEPREHDRAVRTPRAAGGIGDVSRSSVTVPPSAATRLSLPAAKNATCCAVGRPERIGRVRRCRRAGVPRRCRAAASTGADGLIGSAATNARRRPSGESASVSVRYIPSGGSISACSASGGAASVRRRAKPVEEQGDGDERRRWPPQSSRQPRACAGSCDGRWCRHAGRHRHRSGMRRRSAGRSSCRAGDAAGVRRRRGSASGRSGSFARQAWISASSAAGVTGTIDDTRAGSSRRMALMTRAGVSPSNALSPVSISKSTRAEREDVSARIDLAAVDLLRRHVGKRAEDGAFGGQAGDGRSGSDSRLEGRAARHARARARNRATARRFASS